MDKLQIGGYTREVENTPGGIQTVKITWPDGTRTPKHDHNCAGEVRVMKGLIFQVIRGLKTYHQAGDSFMEVVDGVPHIIGNDSGSEAVTMHIYQGALKMNTFPDDDSDRAALGGN